MLAGEILRTTKALGPRADGMAVINWTYPLCLMEQCTHSIKLSNAAKVAQRKTRSRDGCNMSELKSKNTRKHTAESPDFSRRSFLATAGTVGVVAAFDARDLKAETQPTDQTGTNDQLGTVSL